MKKLPLQDKPVRRRILSWAMYDWANSAFATTIMAAVLPAYYGRVAGATLPGNLAEVYWGYTNTLVMILIAFSAPVLGAIADARRSKMKFLTAFAVLGMIVSMLLYTVTRGEWLLASVLYITARIGFSGANVFYDSLLPHVSPDDRIDSVSALGYTLGYVGGGMLLLVNIIMIQNPALFGLADAAHASRFSFVTVGIWWMIFSIPLWRNIREPVIESVQPVGPVIRSSFARLRQTFTHLKEFKQAFRFLIAFWLYNDGIGTIILMAVIFGTGIGIEESDLIGAILLVQFVGIPFTLLFGRLAGRIGAKTAINIGLIVYTMISIGGYLMQSALHFWILAVAVGMVQGGTQALSRSVFGVMTPKKKSAEFFGFFDVSQKFSGILGPALFGLVGQIFGSTRLSIISLIIFFVGGILLLRRVDVDEGREAARRADREMV